MAVKKLFKNCFISKRGLKVAKIPKWIFGRNKEYEFLSHYDVFFPLNWLYWRLLVVCEEISSILCSIWTRLDRKWQKSANFQNLNVCFHPISMWYLQNTRNQSIKKVSYFYFEIGTEKGQNSEISYRWKEYRFVLICIQFWWGFFPLRWLC